MGEHHHPELPFPMTDDEIRQVARKTLEVRLNWMRGTESDGWRFVSKEKGALVEELEIPETSIKVIRATKTLTGVNVKQILQAIQDPSVENRRRIWEEIIDYQIVHRVDQDTHIGYSHYKTPMITANREFVTVQTSKVLDDGGRLVVVESINYFVDSVKPGFVRGVSNCGILAEPQEERGCIKISTVEYIDPKGSIPSFLLNVYKKKAGKRLNRVQEVFKA